MGGKLVNDDVHYADGFRVVTTRSASVRVVDGGAVLEFSDFAYSTSGTPGAGGMGMSSSEMRDSLRAVSEDGGTWKWLAVSPHVSPAPIAYHPDDVSVWTRTRAACENGLTQRAEVLPVGRRAVRFCGKVLHPATRAITDCHETGDLTPLSGLPGLEKVVLYDNAAITDLTPLQGLVYLREVRIPNSSVSDLTPLMGLERLQWLDLFNTRVSDLRPLHGLKQLRILGIGGIGGIRQAPVSNEQLDALQAALPELEIQR